MSQNYVKCDIISEFLLVVYLSLRRLMPSIILMRGSDKPSLANSLLATVNISPILFLIFNVFAIKLVKNVVISLDNRFCFSVVFPVIDSGKLAAYCLCT